MASHPKSKITIETKSLVVLAVLPRVGKKTLTMSTLDFLFVHDIFS